VTKNSFFLNFLFQQADNFTNSLGILQQFATPSQFPGFGNKTPQQQQSEGIFMTKKQSLYSLYL